MTQQHGISVTFGAVARGTPVDSTTVIGIVGDGTAGAPASVLAEPVAVRTLEDAETQFGSAGSLIDACKTIFALTSVWVVGIRYDSTISAPADLVTAIAAAVNALLIAEAATGHAPTLIGAPGLTFEGRDDPAANAVATLLNTVAGRLGAYAVVDASNDTVANVKLWSDNNGAARLIPIPQAVTTPEVTDLPGSAYILGAIAVNDADNGIRDSISNRVLSHIVSVSPEYSFSYTDASSEAADLDTDDLTTIVRHSGAWRAWGGKTKYGSTTDLRRYANIGRVFDRIEERIVDIAQHMLGRGIRNDFINRLVSNVQDYLDSLVASGDVASGVALPDESQNTQANLNAGKVYLTLQVQPVPNAALITLTIEIG